MTSTKGQTAESFLTFSGFLAAAVHDSAYTAAAKRKDNISCNTIVQIDEKDINSENKNIGNAYIHTAGTKTKSQVSFPPLTLSSTPLGKK